MSYTKEREQFVAAMAREGLSYMATRTLLRAATTINRQAELACSSEAADRDRIPCPRRVAEKLNYSTKRIAVAVRVAAGQYPCLCDRPTEGHESIPRYRLTEYRAEQRALAAVPAGWRVLTSGDPRGYTLRVIPPSYAARNEGRNADNLDSIGVPSGPSGIRW